MLHRSLKSAAVVGLLFSSVALTTSCGENKVNKYVKDVKLGTYLQEGDLYASFKAVFDIQKVQLPSVTLPISNPKDNDVVYGQIVMAATLEGYTEIGINVNLSAATKAEAGVAKLPNGNPLPISLDGADVLELNIKGKVNSKIYLAIDDSHAMLGFAIAAKELDIIGQTMGNLDIFPRFNIGPVLGVAGLSAGKESGKTSIGLFADLSSVITGDLIKETIASSYLDNSTYKSVKKGSPMSNEIGFGDYVTGSKLKAKKALNMLDDLSESRRVLTVK